MLLQEIVLEAIKITLVPAALAWLAAKFGVRRGLEQAKQERAFDRRLDWYEKAIRVSMKFVYFNQGMAIALKDSNLPRAYGRLEELARESQELLKELQQTINESLIFAKRDMYLSLKKTFAQLGFVSEKTTKLIEEGAKEGDMVQQYESLAKVLETTTFELAKSIREMLGLDPVSRHDFDKNFTDETSSPVSS